MEVKTVPREPVAARRPGSWVAYVETKPGGREIGRVLFPRLRFSYLVAV